MLILTRRKESEVAFRGRFTCSAIDGGTSEVTGTSDDGPGLRRRFNYECKNSLYQWHMQHNEVVKI